MFNFKERIYNPICRNPYIIVYWILKYSGIFKISDKVFLKSHWRLHHGYTLNLDNPRTYGEKLQWIKLYDRNPLYTRMVDKFLAKEYAAQIIGDEYIIPTLGVYDNISEINLDDLPNRFVLKCTHDSGSVSICNDKTRYNPHTELPRLQAALSHNYYNLMREWPYKNVTPRIIAEQFISDNNPSLVDYKFYCFNGNVDSVMLCVDRFTDDIKYLFFDKDWNFLRINKRGLSMPKGFTLPKPPQMDKMFELAANLSKGIPFIRVDFYICNENIYFGELTFFPDSGMTKNLPRQTQERWGDKIDLSLAYRYSKYRR